MAGRGKAAATGVLTAGGLLAFLTALTPALVVVAVAAMLVVGLAVVTVVLGAVVVLLSRRASTHLMWLLGRPLLQREPDDDLPSLPKSPRISRVNGDKPSLRDALVRWLLGQDASSQEGDEE